MSHERALECAHNEIRDAGCKESYGDPPMCLAIWVPAPSNLVLVERVVTARRLGPDRYHIEAPHDAHLVTPERFITKRSQQREKYSRERQAQ